MCILAGIKCYGDTQCSDTHQCCLDSEMSSLFLPSIVIQVRATAILFGLSETHIPKSGKWWQDFQQDLEEDS